MAAAVDESKSYLRYKVVCDDLRDIISLLEDELKVTPSPTLRSLQFSESQLAREYESFENLWSVCQDAIDSSEYDKECRDHRALKRNAWKLQTDLKSAIDSRLAQSPPVGQTFSNPTPSQVVVPAKHLPHPKLPEIKIPEFNGELSHWNSFWDSFSSLIDSRQDIDPVLKFNMLRSYLRGKAYRTIEGLSITNDNYSVALKLLKSRFADDKQLLQQLHLQLMNMKPPEHTLKDLTDFRLTFERLLLQIESVTKVPCDDYLLKDIISKKLSVQTLEYLFNKYSTYDLTLQQLSNGIGHLIKVMECSQSLSDQSVNSTGNQTSNLSSHSKTRHNQNFNKTNSISKQVTVSSQKSNVNTANSSKVQTSWNRPCMFCSETHSSKLCSKYPTWESRKNRIRDLDCCFVCMKKGHRASDCRVTPECRHCSGKHHTFLCMKLINGSASINQVATNPSQVTSNKGSNLSSSESPTSQVLVGNGKGSRTVTVAENSNSIVSSVQTDTQTEKVPLTSTALPTAIVKISGSGVREVVRVFLDTGAQRTFIHSALASRLKLKPMYSISLKLIAFGNHVQTVTCDVVRVVVRVGTQRIPIFAVVYDEVNTELHIPGIANVAKKLKEKGIKLADPYINSDVISDIGLVIGADYYSRFVTNSTFCSGVVLLSSPAGSIIFGPMPKWADGSQTVNNISVQHSFCARIGVQLPESELNQIENLWKLDVVGIKTETLTPEETQSVRHFESTCQRVGNQYFVELPFKSDERPATNYRKAYGQLKSLSKSFAARPGIYEQYSKIFSEYLDLGFIEEVDNPEVIDGLTYYLPYHSVYKNSPTTPIRVVFNASSKADSKSKSLNDCLLTGPSLTSKLVESLVEFRTNPVAVVADISKAFLRIGISPNCRDYCRFLWYDDQMLQKVVTYRFKVVLFGVTSSPFLLQKILTYHLENHSNPLAKTLISRFYVDNFAHTYVHVDQLKSDYPQINAIMSEASMPLQCWVSNNSKFNEDIGINQEKLNLHDVNVLGISWNSVSDEISLYQSKKVCKEECMHHQITKRLALSVISSVFDPLGFLSPVLIKGKLFIQKLWKCKYSWDEQLPESLVQEFQSICQSLSQISAIKFPRCVINPNISDLHIFCDSSAVAYGLVAYAVDSGNKSSNLLMSKVRVAPSPPLTIPKLELLALTLATRLAETLLSNNEFGFRSCTLWTDSEVTISWVYHDKSSEVFVSNRVAEIRTLRRDYNLCILHVPSSQNSADLVTRGVTVSKLANSLMWKHGPSFLLNPLEYPPQKEFVCNSAVVSEILVEPNIIQPICPVFDMGRYSTLTKVMRVISKVMKFCNKYFPDKFKLNTLHSCIRLAQLQSFPTLFEYLKQPEKSPKPATEILNLAKQLDMFMNEDQLICCGGRLQNSDLSPETQCPIYLPAKHPLTKLIITHYHNHHCHCGLSQTLLGLRQQFWISKARVIIKNIISKCVLCRKVVGKTIPQPGPPPLPEERVRYVRPFSSVGVDFTGSITIVDPATASDSERVYVCLFTCTTSRAVHLELCSSLTTSEFLLALRRFGARFGVPSVVISDNGTNFRGAERFLNDIKDEPEVRTYMQDNNIVWKFNTPRSPWSGGFFERLIGSVKSSLHKSLFKKRISFNELRTLLCEIECIINSRPITYLSEDIREEYLSPSHLIYGRTVTLFPPLNSFGADVPYRENLDLRVQYARLSDLLKKYEKVWMNSYLTSLKERHLTCAKDKSCLVKVGDLVLVLIENKTRANYPLGLVTQLIKGNDDVVRSAIVHTADVEYMRPISKLIPLELHHEVIPDVEPIASPIPPAVPNAPPRPKRHAACKAEQLRRDLIDNDLL